MRIGVLVILGVLPICLFSQQMDERGFIVKVGDVAPDFELELTNGSNFKLTDYEGKLVLLQFTASWCGVCRREMPHIESEIWQPNKNKNFIVVGIDRDEPLEKVIEFSKQTGISYPLALDPKAKVFGNYAGKEAGVTRTVLIDKTGKIIFLTRLFNKEEFSNLVDRINKELGN